MDIPFVELEVDIVHDFGNLANFDWTWIYRHGIRLVSLSEESAIELMTKHKIMFITNANAILIAKTKYVVTVFSNKDLPNNSKLILRLYNTGHGYNSIFWPEGSKRIIRKLETLYQEGKEFNIRLIL